MEKVPCKVYYGRKVLTANTEAELEALIRIGWKVEEPSADR